MLTVEGLRMELEGLDLGPLDLSIRDGDYFVLLGPSGAGKTSLLEWIAGFRDARAGRLTLGDVDATGAAPRDRGFGLVTHDPLLFPHLSVRENFAYPLRLAGWSEERQRRRIQELGGLLRIERRLDARPARLSGGERRRAALGRALAAGPRLLLLDEPLDGLDPGLRRDLRLELTALQQRLHFTVLHITHQLDEARLLASRLAVMLDGRIAQVGTPAEILDAPCSAGVARFLLVPNVVEGICASGILELRDGTRLPAPGIPDGPVQARFDGARLWSEAGTGRVRLTVRGRDGDRVVAGSGDSGSAETRFEAPWSGAGTPAPGDAAWLDMSAADWTIY